MFVSLVEEVAAGDPGFGCMSPEYRKSIASQVHVVKVVYSRILKIRSINSAVDIALVPNNKRLLGPYFYPSNRRYETFIV